jgi:hypothetical protein
VPRLFAVLGVPIRSVTVTRPSLDDVFLAHTGSTIRDAERTGHAEPDLRRPDNLNPMTYVVEPMRAVVFDNLDVDPTTWATLDPGIFWFGWPVPIWLQVTLVVACSTALLGVAVARFARTE